MDNHIGNYFTENYTSHQDQCYRKNKCHFTGKWSMLTTIFRNAKSADQNETSSSFKTKEFGVFTI